MFLKSLLSMFILTFYLQARAQFTSLDEQNEVVEKIFGLSLDSSETKEIVFKGVVGETSHNDYIGEPCTVRLIFSKYAFNEGLFSFQTQIESYRDKTWFFATAIAKLESITDNRFKYKDSESKVLSQKFNLDGFGLHGFIDYSTGEIIRISSNKIYPALGCMSENYYYK